MKIIIEMATVDFSRYRRIVQKLWDPEPTNDAKADQPAWCLGSSYTLATDVLSHEIDVTPSVSSSKASQIDSRSSIGSNPSPEQPAEDPAGSQPLTRHTKYAGGDGGWPSLFLDDVEARIWMTYRSDFEPIRRSPLAAAASSLSLPVRVKAQFMDQNGFSSDSGWGCMIRSGQSLLANTISIQRLGRSTLKLEVI